MAFDGAKLHFRRNEFVKREIVLPAYKTFKDDGITGVDVVNGINKNNDLSENLTLNNNAARCEHISNRESLLPVNGTVESADSDMLNNISVGNCDAIVSQKCLPDSNVLWLVNRDDNHDVDHEEVIESVRSLDHDEINESLKSPYNGDLSVDHDNIIYKSSCSYQKESKENEICDHDCLSSSEKICNNQEWQNTDSVTLPNQNANIEGQLFSAINSSNTKNVTVQPVRDVFTSNCKEYLQSIKGVYNNIDNGEQVVVQTFPYSPSSIDHEEIVESVGKTESPADNVQPVIQSLELENITCLPSSNEIIQNNKRNEVVEHKEAEDENPIKIGQKYPVQEMKSTHNQPQSLKLHMMFVQNLLQKSLAGKTTFGYQSEHRFPETDNVEPPTANSLQTGMLEVLNMTSFRPVSPVEQENEVPVSYGEKDTSEAFSVKPTDIKSKVFDKNKKVKSLCKEKGDCNSGDRKGSVFVNKENGNTIRKSKTKEIIKVSTVHDGKDQKKESSLQSNTSKETLDTPKKQVKLKISLKNLLRNAKSLDTNNNNNEFFIKSPIRCDICPKVGKKGRQKKCGHIILAENAFLKSSAPLEDCKTPTGKTYSECRNTLWEDCITGLKNVKDTTDMREETDTNQLKMKESSKSVNETNNGNETCTFPNKLARSNQKTPPGKASKILDSFKQHLQSDQYFQSQLKETSEWLVSRWKSYIDANADTLRDFEVENAINYKYNDEAKDMVGDGDRYVWHLIEQI